MMRRFRQQCTLAACIGAGVTCAPATLSAQATPPNADLVGLWGAEPILNPQPHGMLLLTQRGGEWLVRVGGVEASAAVTGDSIDVSLPGETGRLRARRRGTGVTGMWVQPGQAGPAYATPLRFSPAGAGTWRAELRTLELRFGLYLSLQRAAGDTLTVVFRNPLWNWPGRPFSARRIADTLLFLDRGTGRVRYRQAYDSAERRITFDFGTTFALTPRTRATAPGFVARTPSSTPWTYVTPAALDDGWEPAHASAVGMDVSALEATVRRLAATDPLDDAAPRVHALLVARRGRLVLDEYFHGYRVDERHDLRSASKTITSIMVGVAMHRGARLSASTRVAGAPWTVGNLLTHTSGAACDDDDDASPGSEDRMQSQSAEPDWYRFFKQLPQREPPGRTYRYCSAGINMVGSVIRDATQRWLPEFFETELARPLQIDDYAINLMPTGEAYSGGGMFLRPRDFLKFGELYRAGGVWRGRRLVDRAWVRASTDFQVQRPDSSDDGFGWHRHRITVAGRAYQTYEASGNGGQFVIVVPALELVVATTAGNYGQYGAWRRIREQLLPQIMAAAR